MKRLDIYGQGGGTDSAPRPESQSRPETFMRHVIMDTRQQEGKHDYELTWFRENSVTVVRSKLPWGDYSLPPARSVDTKQNIKELHMDLTKDHDRFALECDGAYENECELTILVCNEHGVTDLDSLSGWLEPMGDFVVRKKKSKNKHLKRISGATMAKSCRTFAEDHHCRFMFCRPDECGFLINEILEGRI